MDIIMESLANMAKRFQDDGKIRLYAIIGLLTGLLTTIGGSLIKITVIFEILGCLSGCLIFVSAYLIWFQLPEDIRDKADLRGTWDIGKRRWVAGWFSLLWFLLLAFGAHFFPKTLVGALNVAVLLTLWRIVTLTKLERALDAEEAKVVSKWPVDKELSTETEANQGDEN